MIHPFPRIFIFFRPLGDDAAQRGPPVLGGPDHRGEEALGRDLCADTRPFRLYHHPQPLLPEG